MLQLLLALVGIPLLCRGNKPEGVCKDYAHDRSNPLPAHPQVASHASWYRHELEKLIHLIQIVLRLDVVLFVLLFQLKLGRQRHHGIVQTEEEPDGEVLSYCEVENLFQLVVCWSQVSTSSCVIRGKQAQTYQLIRFQARYAGSLSCTISR